MGKIKEKDIELIDISGGKYERVSYNILDKKYKEGYNKGFVHGIWTCSFILLIVIIILLVRLALL